MTNWHLYSCLWLGFSSALVAGVFQSFSDFVMAGLARTTPAGAIESMQHINRTVFRSVFLTTFFSLVPLTVGFAIYACSSIEGHSRLLIIAAAVTYVTSVFGVTVFGNVPMNERLASLDASSVEGADYWRTYRPRWTRLNHIRTIGAATTAALYLLAVAH